MRQRALRMNATPHKDLVEQNEEKDEGPPVPKLGSSASSTTESERKRPALRMNATPHEQTEPSEASANKSKPSN